jgi:radical SAM family uncharacterized protein/radical SAM-linked protein
MNETHQELLVKNILPKVSKPARYIGNELHIVKKDPQKIRTRVALAFPELYEIGMSYYGFEILYHILNEEKNIWAERVFAPWLDMEELLRKYDIPLFSLESFTALCEFDIIGFTLQSELTYSNILNMLDISRVPVFSSDRDERDPFVIGGGPCSCNPEPMAAFFDAFFIGDAEEDFKEICDRVTRGRRAGLSRIDILYSLEDIEGIYIPSFFEAMYDHNGKFSHLKRLDGKDVQQTNTRIITELKPDYYPEKPIVPLINVTHNRLSVEVMRGCTQGCRYCNAGMIYRPVRERDYNDIVQQIMTSLPFSGYEEVSFLSLSISDYSQLDSLFKAEKKNLENMQVNYAFPSMRLDSFSEEIACYASKIRKSGFTFAPESGSTRLRRVINKNITNEEIYQSVDVALQKGWRLLKFYFMIGLPTEKKEDIEEIVAMMEKVITDSKRYGRVRFNLSVSTFSPKAHTPFQWEAQEPKEVLEEKLLILRKKLSKYRNLKLSWRDTEVSQLECILGRGDRRLSMVIYDAWRSGAKFDGWTDYFKFNVWQNAFKEAGIVMDHLSGNLFTENALPWDHINKGVSKEFLLNERSLAFKEKITVDCREGRCLKCGTNKSIKPGKVQECYPQKEIKFPKYPSKRPRAARDISHSQQLDIYQRFRFKYQKLGLARFLAHLDLVRLFQRAFRMAKITVKHSEGYNPRPLISFSAPLSLGYTSEAEYFDIRIKNIDLQKLPEKLNPYLPQGLKISDTKRINEKTNAISSEVNRSHYLIDLKNLNLEHDKLTGKVAELMESSSITVERHVKGKIKTVDIRPFIDSIHRKNGSLVLHTKFIDSRTVRVSEVLNQLFDKTDIVSSLPVHRSAQLIARDQELIDPIDIVS